MIPSIKNIAPNTMSSMIIPRLSNPIFQDSLLLHLDAGNKNSYPGTGTTWYDLSGNGRNATLVGSPTYVNDATTGGYLTFGSGKYATLPASFLAVGAEPFTVEAWVRPASTASVINPIFYSDSGTSASCIALVLDSNNFFGMRMGSTPLTQYHQTAAAANTWYHVIISREKGQAGATLYYFSRTTVNCVPSTNVYLSSNTSIGSASPRIGSNPADSTFFNGDIAVVRVYSRGLPSTEMYNNFIASRSKFNVV